MMFSTSSRNITQRCDQATEYAIQVIYVNQIWYSLDIPMTSQLKCQECLHPVYIAAHHQLYFPPKFKKS
jgi:hypothetical protein